MRCSHLVWGHQPPTWDRNRSGKKEVCCLSMETHMERQTQARRVDLIVCARRTLRRKNHDDGHTTCSSLRPHRARSVHRTGQCDVQKPQKMGTVVGRTQACPISTVAWFFGEKRVPQTATRVEQISEWITTWRGFNVTQGAEFVRAGTLDGALFNKAQIIDSFSKHMEMQTWKKSGRTSAQFGHGERHHYRFCQEGQISADHRG